VSTPWSIVVTPHAEGEIGRLDASIRDGVLDAVRDLAIDPSGMVAAGAVRRLTDAPSVYNLRVGDLRVQFGLGDAGDLVILGVTRQSRAD